MVQDLTVSNFYSSVLNEKFNVSIKYLVRQKVQVCHALLQVIAYFVSLLVFQWQLQSKHISACQEEAIQMARTESIC